MGRDPGQRVWRAKPPEAESLLALWRDVNDEPAVATSSSKCVAINPCSVGWMADRSLSVCMVHAVILTGPALEVAEKGVTQ